MNTLVLLTLRCFGGGGGGVLPFPLGGFALGNPYLKILDFFQLIVRKKKSNNQFYPLTEHFWDNQYKNNFDIFAVIKKNLLTNTNII